MTSRLLRVAPLLFVSGFTSLVYQVAWMRELRLIFGFSTAASAAVIAIFLGGLGLGSWLLGRRADEASHPLVFYGRLELAIAASAAATPGLVWLVRQAYIAFGGSFGLGLPIGTAVRLLLSALVLCLPTVLMGGTLPAATRAAESDDDLSRRRTAVLYGVNTLGAMVGAAISTFWLLEILGTRATLWLACLVNAAVGLAALRLGRAIVVGDTTRGDPEAQVAASSSPSVAAGDLASPPRGFVLGAAAVAGFVFASMELVWYRKLSPLLGGSTYTFGLILVVALAGIGLGGAAYGRFSRNRPATLGAFAATCGFEAFGLVIPYAVGDRLAIFAALQRSLGAFGFAGVVASWAEVACVVVLPAAFVAGIQFPLLVALVGRGRKNVGRHVGVVYAWNTLGAIAGSLAGGFGLLPLLSAPTSWVALVLLLAILGVCALFLARGPEGRPRPLAVVVVATAIAASVVLVTAAGPTAAWRHSPIGAGRVQLAGLSPNALKDWQRGQRRALAWQKDGVESSVGLLRTGVGFAFAINGKIDGSAIGDAATQVMGGLVAAALHPDPKRALVIGLGTGSTAGWLAAVASIERVDVVELEPAVLEVARQCAPVNGDVLHNAKVRILIGDARELLLTSRTRYDVIFSEPSNPYRAGISSLFTREFYGAVASRLSKGGVFAQWLQAYEVDGKTVRTSYATLASVFPSVESWFTKKDDLLLVASAQPIPYRAVELRGRLRQKPFSSAMAFAWRVADLEGFLSHYVARDSLARAIARQEEAVVNSDDRNLMEFGFARSVGQSALFQSDELRRLAHARGEDRPAVEGEVDWTAVERQRLSTFTAEGVTGLVWPELPPAEQQKASVYERYTEGKLGEVRGLFLAAPWEPAGPLELVMIGEALADGGDSRAATCAIKLRDFQPAESDAVLARYLWTQQNWEACFTVSAAALQKYRADPWPLAAVMRRLLAIVVDLAARDPSLAARGCDLLAPSFAVSLLDEDRTNARLTVCRQVDAAKTAEVFRALEPNTPWHAELLEARAQAYAAAGDLRAAAARAELETFWKRESAPFSAGLEPTAPR
jgi:spermidine synthase